ncbi:serine hydrolase domain-containing protein [Stappia indica]|uniref:serine hydrolase domain-containing protein n=1 Tax=Stappia indica TaxID=538381 RepID=UPI001CD258B2|nr:serine hydrolase domain-containing protein [Stappia indica]MCA1299320.1 beta-lactamase family protein [Stappia indica]
MLKIILMILAPVVLAIAAVVYLEYRAFAFSAPALPETGSPANSLETIADWLEQLHTDGHFTGSVLVSHRGIPILEKHLGPIGPDGARPITARTSFNLASVTKQFTATAVLRLEQEGLLKRGDAVTRYLPELKRYPGITIYHLLAGTSGLPDYVSADPPLAKGGQMVTPELLLNWLALSAPSGGFPPGSRYEYSNTGYLVLAQLVARVSGKPYAQYMQDTFFEPLGMKDTQVFHKGIEREPAERALGMRKRFFYRGAFVLYDLNRFDGGAGDGNIYASPRDLVTWHEALRDGRALDRQFHALLTEPVRLEDGTVVADEIFGKNTSVGLAWNTNRLPALNVYGRWQGFSNYYYRDDRRDLVIVFLANSAHFLPFAEITDMLTSAVDKAVGED